MSRDGRYGVVPIALVACGGALGAVLRHVLTVALPVAALGTLAVNVLGSFALGLVLSEHRVATRLSGRTRLVVATGFLSSFTTYSTFAVEATQLAPMAAVVYVAGNYALATLAAVLAHGVTRWSG